MFYYIYSHFSGNIFTTCHTTDTLTLTQDSFLLVWHFGPVMPAGHMTSHVPNT